MVKSMSDEKAIMALCSDGRLIKRPFLVDSKGKILVGFKESAWQESLLN